MGPNCWCYPSLLPKPAHLGSLGILAQKWHSAAWQHWGWRWSVNAPYHPSNGLAVNSKMVKRPCWKLRTRRMMILRERLRSKSCWFMLCICFLKNLMENILLWTSSEVWMSLLSPSVLPCCHHICFFLFVCTIQNAKGVGSLPISQEYERQLEEMKRMMAS